MKGFSIHRLGNTLLLGMMAVGFIAALGYGLVLYKTLADGERNELEKIAAAVMRPVKNLASLGINGGNIMKLKSTDATSLYSSSEVLYLDVNGTSQGSPKTAFSAALPPQPISYQYVAEGVDEQTIEALLADTSNVGVIEQQWLYVIRSDLPDVVNGGQIVAVFSAEQLKGSIARTLKSVSMISAVIFIVTVLGAHFVGLLITRPIIRVSKGIGEISKSLDLSKRVNDKCRNEVGDTARTFNHLIERIQSMIANVDSSISGLSHSSQHLTEMTHASNKQVNEQESQTEQVATAMTEMAAVVDEVAQNAKSAADFASKANQDAESGRLVVENTVSIINEVAREVDNTSSVVQNLVEQSNTIGSVLDVIRGIAEQTNLLALNAAIEAARAGEQGRGFAVVADEVRTLAGRTQQSTEEIQKMIEQLQVGATAAKNAMLKGQEQVSIAVTQANSAGESLSEITKSIASISMMNQHIAISVDEQAKVAEEINKNIVRIRELTELTAEVSRTTEDESTQLTRMSEELKLLVRQFHI